MKNAEILSPSCHADDGQSIPDGVEYPNVYRAALEVLKDVRSDGPIKFDKLSSEIIKSLDQAPKQYLIYRDMNIASQDPLSPIRSRKGRAGGYFSVGLARTESAEVIPTKAELKKEKTLEKHIWPLVAHWFREVKRIPNVSSRVANLTKGGVWSNPDVVGLHPIDEMGFFDVEITTAEVKPSLDKWQFYFFEAVSHKRISDQVYYVFRSNDEDLNKIQELKRYSEKYGVGLVEMQMDDMQYASLAKWNSLSKDDLANLLDSIVEHIPAPAEPLPIRAKINFLKQIKVSSKKDIYSFGANE